jgi:hypothetical protein
MLQKLEQAPKCGSNEEEKKSLIGPNIFLSIHPQTFSINLPLRAREEVLHNYELTGKTIALNI